MAGTRRDRHDWAEVAPGLGLVFGAAVALIVALVVPDGTTWLGTSMALGGGIGLVVGSLVWLQRRR